MTDQLTQIDIRQLQEAFDAVGSQKELMQKQFGTEEIAHFLSFLTGHYVRGVLERMGLLEFLRQPDGTEGGEGEESPETKKPTVEIGMPEISEFALALIMFGISVGRLYREKGEDCSVKPCTMSAAYNAFGKE